MRTHTNDISIRFKTREPDGLLFTTSNNQNDDFLRAVMDRGRVKVLHNIGGEERVSAVLLWTQKGILNRESLPKILDGFQSGETSSSVHSCD